MRAKALGVLKACVCAENRVARAGDDALTLKANKHRGAKR